VPRGFLPADQHAHGSSCDCHSTKVDLSQELGGELLDRQRVQAEVFYQALQEELLAHLPPQIPRDYAFRFFVRSRPLLVERLTPLMPRLLSRRGDESETLRQKSGPSFHRTNPGSGQRIRYWNNGDRFHHLILGQPARLTKTHFDRTSGLSLPRHTQGVVQGISQDRPGNESVSFLLDDSVQTTASGVAGRWIETVCLPISVLEVW
jgi:hypothetical protein